MNTVMKKTANKRCRVVPNELSGRMILSPCLNDSKNQHVPRV